MKDVSSLSIFPLDIFIRFFSDTFLIKAFGNKVTIPSRFVTALLCVGGKYCTDAHLCSNKTITYFRYILFQTNEDVLACRWTLCVPTVKADWQYVPPVHLFHVWHTSLLMCQCVFLKRVQATSLFSELSCRTVLPC